MHECECMCGVYQRGYTVISLCTVVCFSIGGTRSVVSGSQASSRGTPKDPKGDGGHSVRYTATRYPTAYVQ